MLQIIVTGEQSAAAKLLEKHDSVERVATIMEMLAATLKKGITDDSDLATVLGSSCVEEVNLESAFMALTKVLGQRA